jgi:hypothetical protein
MPAQKRQRSQKDKAVQSRLPTAIISGIFVLIGTAVTAYGYFDGLFTWPMAFHILIHQVEMLFYGASFAALMFSITQVHSVSQRWLIVAAVAIVTFGAYLFFSDWQSSLPAFDFNANFIATLSGMAALVFGWGITGILTETIVPQSAQ